MRGRRVAFSPRMLVAGYGAAWAADYDHPLIVRIDPGRMDGEIAAVFPEDDQPSPGQGPRAIAAGLGSIWVLPAGGTRLVQVNPGSAAPGSAAPGSGDPGSGAPGSGVTRSRELPFALSDICVGSDAIFGIELFGDGRVARIDPDGGVAEATVGRTLALVAAAGDLAWVVDDEPGLVLALDARSLAKVAEFKHIGGPQALVASGSRAWYLARHEVQRVGEHGRRERAFVFTADGPGSDLLRFDAQTGTLDRLGRRAWATGRMALANDRLWIASRHHEDVADDEPTSCLNRVDADGRSPLIVERPGQIDALAVGDGTVWVSGFRRSQQADVTTMLTEDGQVLGQVSFAGVDLRPWTPAPPPRRPRVSLAARARAIRDEAERDLSEPEQHHGRFGDTWQEPAVSEEFRLERVEVRGTDREPEIAVLFRWADEEDLFGMRYWVPRRGEVYISVYVAEHLLADGIETAIREPADGVTWLRWQRAEPD